jgi:F-type H+-transporting ATPase subunit delta
MSERTLAKRYARALLEVASERGVITPVEEELHAIAAVHRDVPELDLLLRDPARPLEAKRALLERAFQGKVSDLVLHFLTVVLEKGRFSAIEEIAKTYDDLSDEAQGVARVHVTTYSPLGEEQRAALTRKLQGLTARPNIVLQETVDPSILGGVIVRIGDQVVDGSVRGRLRSLRERLVVREDQVAAAAMAMATSH